MSTITKQWLQQKISDMEATRDEIPFGLGEDDSNMLAALRIALASLEAEAVGEVIEQQSGMMLDGLVISEKPIYRNIKGIHNMKMMPLGTKFYTAHPAPAVPTFDEWLEIRGNKPLGWVKDAMRESYDACRAAMLNKDKNNG